MDFDIVELQKKVTCLQAEQVTLHQQCIELRDEFKAYYPASISPVFLARNSDKSLTPLIWRYSSKSGKKGLRPKVDDFWLLVAEMSEVDQKKLAEVEMQKIQLNYQLSTVSYELSRVQILLEETQTWQLKIKRLF